MKTMTLQLDRADGRYVPGEPITGWVAWEVPEEPESVTVQLCWETSGKGRRDNAVVAEQVFDQAGLRAEHPFTFDGVDGPYSFSGNLITIAWKIKAKVKRGKSSFEISLTLSPTGEEMRV